MRLVLADATLLKDSITIISELVHEARFKVSKDGLELVAMDPANVAMVVYKLLSSAFAEYDLKQETELGINLTSFKQILKRAKANDLVILELEESKLKIQLKGNSVRTFSMPIIDLEEKEQRVPNLNFPISIHTNSKALNDAIDDADIVAESVTFAAEPDLFTVYAEGDLNKASIEIKADDSTKINSETKAKVKAKYSIEYLKKIIQGAKLADEAGIYFNQDYPLKVEYKVIDKVLLSFILAPRVEND